MRLRAGSFAHGLDPFFAFHNGEYQISSQFRSNHKYIYLGVGRARKPLPISSRVQSQGYRHHYFTSRLIFLSKITRKAPIGSIRGTGTVRSSISTHCWPFAARTPKVRTLQCDGMTEQELR